MSESAVAMVVPSAGAPMVAQTVPVREPHAGEVRVRVRASGICGADLGTAQGRADAPVTPGHEIAGTVAAVGQGVSAWEVGDRVAIGWFGGSCGRCQACRRGDVVHCPDRQIPGLSYPGGWAESITVPADALARVPDGLDLLDAAPMGCAGVTTWNALRGAGLAPGARVAVLGLGGLGHLAVQFAAAMGHEVTAIARGPERAAAARDLGAHHYLDSTEGSAGAALRRQGGVDFILSTAPSGQPLRDVLQGLRVHGTLVLVGVTDRPLDLPQDQVVMNALTVSGHLTGGPLDTEATMRFALLHDIRPVTERLPLSAAHEGVDRVRQGRARFRVVLEPGSDGHDAR